MLNIARNIYLGWNIANQKFELPEVEVIPIGDSVNEKRKGISVTKKYANLKEFENFPLPGFTLYKADRKNYGSIDQTWLVIDPRGYLVRITNENLETILHVTGITEGLIQEKCIWARNDTQTKMMLIPVSSSKYSEAERNTTLLESKVEMKDVQIGDTVLLQNQLVGTYMGVASMYGPLNEYTSSDTHKPQVYLRRQVVKISPGKYHYQTDVKILKVVNKTVTPVTREDAVAEMNADIASGVAFFTNTIQITGKYWSVRGVISHVSVHAVPKPTVTFVEIDKKEAEELFNIALAANNDVGKLLLEDSAGRRFLLDYPYAFNGSVTVSMHNFDISELVSCTLDPTDVIKIKRKQRSYFNRQAIVYKSIDDFTKFYKIVKHVKTETYI
jgi:hypothetical protein